MTLAPLQADVLEWVLPRHRIWSKTSGTRLSRRRLRMASGSDKGRQGGL